MRCTRCAGLRVHEIIYEGGSRVLALRCIHCGDVIDRVIVLNRQRRLYSKPAEAECSSNVEAWHACGFNTRQNS